MKLYSLCMDTKQLSAISNMTPEDAVSNAENAAQELVKRLKAIFPDYMIGANVKTIMSGKSLVLDFANVSSKDQAPNGIMHNVSGYFTIVMDVANSGMNSKPITKFEMEMLRGGVSRRVQSFGVKQFRKISGKTPAECVQKLLKWFENNAEALRNLPVSVY